MSNPKRHDTPDDLNLPELEFEPLAEDDDSARGQVVELSVHRRGSSPRPGKKKKRLGDMLIDAGFIDQDGLRRALTYQKVHGGKIGSILVRLGLLDEQKLNSTLGKQFGIATAEVEDIDPDPRVLALIPEPLVRRHEVIPIALSGHVLQVGMTNPHDISAVDELRFATSRRLDVRLITESTFRRFVRTRYTTGALVREIVRDARNDEHFAELNQRIEPRLADRPNARHPSVARLVNYLLDRAVREHVTDVHIEPYETFDRIRMRGEDGGLTTVLTPPRQLHSPILDRLTAIAGAEVGRDGHFVLREQGARVHVRMTTMPTVFGTAGVLHLRRHDPRLMELSALGMSRGTQDLLKHALAGCGLVLIAGPTDAGCTTTMHACINLMNEPDRHIVCVEDPVEETVPGVNHVPLDRASGRGYAETCELAMRQDADMLVVGDVADTATADAVLSAASHGRLVIAGIHAQDTTHAILRFRELASQQVLMVSSLRLVLAQRRVRRVCPKCAVPVSPSAAEIRASGITQAQLAQSDVRIGRGCRRCNDTGFAGYTGVFESVQPTADQLHELRNALPSEFSKAMHASRGDTLWGAAVAHVLAGETTFGELGRLRR